MAEIQFLGYDKKADDVDFLQNGGRTFAACAAADRVPVAPKLDPRQVMPPVNQGKRNSCVGNAKARAGRVCWYLDRGCRLDELGEPFSRWASYIWAQQFSGYLGKDQGAGVSGAIKASQQIGFCPESDCPYPSPTDRYFSKLPPACVPNAAPFKLQKHTPLKSYDQCYEWITQGKGPVLIGVDWTTGLLGLGSPGDLTLAVARSGKFIGGHAVTLWGWDGDRIALNNSHGGDWGDGGVAWVRPEVIDYWYTRGGEFHGMSDLAVPNIGREVVIADAGEGM